MSVDLSWLLGIAREFGIGTAFAVIIGLAWAKGWLISSASHREIVALWRERSDMLEKDRNRAFEMVFEIADAAKRGQGAVHEALQEGQRRASLGERGR